MQRTLRRRNNFLKCDKVVIGGTQEFPKGKLLRLLFQDFPNLMLDQQRSCLDYHVPGSSSAAKALLYDSPSLTKGLIIHSYTLAFGMLTKFLTAVGVSC